MANNLKALMLVAGLVAPSLTHAQAARSLGDFALALYQQANAPDALERMNRDLVRAPEAYLVSVPQPGTLVLVNKRRINVKSMRYNVALRLLEAQDSTGSHVWPPGSLDGFYLGTGSDTRHFRTHMVRNGSTKRDFVEVLTMNDNSPVVLAVQHNYVHEEAQLDPILRTETRKARTEIGQTVIAGSGQQPEEPLRPVALNQRSVAKLFGPKAAQVNLYAFKEKLSYSDLAQVLRLVEYYNQVLAVAK